MKTFFIFGVNATSWRSRATLIGLLFILLVFLYGCGSQTEENYAIIDVNSGLKTVIKTTGFKYNNETSSLTRNASPAAKLSINMLKKCSISSDVELIKVRSETDKFGKTHNRFQQYFKGCRIVGAELIEHIDRDGNVFMINGKNFEPDEQSFECKLSVENAKAILIELLDANSPVNLKDEYEDVIYAEKRAYRITASYNEIGKGYQSFDYYIDANSGDIIGKISNIYSSGYPVTLSGTRLSGEGGGTVSFTGAYSFYDGLYYLLSPTRFWEIHCLTSSLESGTYIFSNSSTSFGNYYPAAISAAYNIDRVIYYTTSVADVPFSGPLDGVSKFYIYDGTVQVDEYYFEDDKARFYGNRDIFIIGDGNGEGCTALTVLDVIAHEFSHAMIKYSSGLL